MKLSCTQENLARGLSLVSNLSNKQVNLPILNNVLLQADKEGLQLITTNLEIGVKTLVRGKVEEPGKFTVQAKLVSDFVNSLKRENINISLDQNSLTLEGENHNTKIKGEAANDFPLIPEVSEDLKTTVKTTNFLQALQQTVFSASLDESRPELNSVLFKFDNKKLIIAATDSYRLSEKSLNLEEVVPSETSLIIPVRTIQQLIKILNESLADQTTIVANDNQVKFTSGETELNSRLVEGNYPDYQQIIPKDFATEILLNVKDLIHAVKTTSLFCQPGINDVKFSYVPNTKEIQLRAQNSSSGDNLSKLEADIQGKAGEIVFNYRYVLEGLNNLGQDKVKIKLNDTNSPALLEALNDKDFVYLIMPIKQ